MSALTGMEQQGLLEIPLTPDEEADLRRHESTIREHKEGFVRAGLAFAAIRDERLYRRTHSTFGDYCREVWQLGGSTAYQLIRTMEATLAIQESVEAGDTVSAIAETPAIPATPQTESHAKALLQVPEPERPAAWEAARELANERGVPISAAIVQEAADRFRPEPPPAREPEIPSGQISLTDDGSVVTDDGSVVTDDGSVVKPPEPVVTIVATATTASPEAVTVAPPPPAVAVPSSTAPTPAPGPMQVALLPTGEVEWLQSQGFTPALAIAKLRELMEETSAASVVGIPPDLWERFERIGAALKPPVSALQFLIERAGKAEELLGIIAA